MARLLRNACLLKRSLSAAEVIVSSSYFFTYIFKQDGNLSLVFSKASDFSTFWALRKLWKCFRLLSF